MIAITLSKMIPNLLTLMRLVFLFLAFDSYYDGSKSVFLLFIFCSLITDFLDGYLARALNATSKLGSILDPACDRVVTLIMFYFFYTEGLLSRFYCFLLFLRPITQIFAFLLAKFYGFKFYIRPGIPSKIHSFFVFSLIFSLCLSLSFGAKTILEDYFIASLWLHIVLVGEIGFLIYYSWQFWRIVYYKKKGFD